MLNTNEAYAECGEKCSRARLDKDEPTSKHWSDYFRKMQALESGADKLRARDIFDAAYGRVFRGRFPK